MKLKHLLVSAALAVPSFAFAGNYTIDTSHSSAQFSVRHMMVANVKGEFDKVEGSVVLDDADPKKNKIEAKIDASTINTRDAKRDGHLKGPDFFDVAKYPTITFKSTEVTKVSDGKYQAKGDLTLRGVTKPVTLDIEAPATEVKDPYGNVKRGAVATTTINRKDFGLNWNVALETGGVLVGDEVKVNIDVELNRTDVKPAAGKAAK